MCAGLPGAAWSARARGRTVRAYGTAAVVVRPDSRFGCCHKGPVAIPSDSQYGPRVRGLRRGRPDFTYDQRQPVRSAHAHISVFLILCSIRSTQQSTLDITS